MVGGDTPSASPRAIEPVLSTTPSNTDIEKALREAAVAPASASNDAGSVSQHSLKDMIELDRYLASKEAVKTKRRGLRVQRIITPGST